MYLATPLVFNFPGGGVPLGRSVWNFLWTSAEGQGTKCLRNIAENFKRPSRAHERYRRQTDRQTTDRRTGDKNSERQREFTFANERHMWRYEFYQPHLVNVATLPCEIRSTENVILQWDIAKFSDDSDVLMHLYSFCNRRIMIIINNRRRLYQMYHSFVEIGQGRVPHIYLFGVLRINTCTKQILVTSVTRENDWCLNLKHVRL